ncbi:metalloprotease family M12A [Achlya hypogyna]|uniref:Metalloendopeptidase n=1 Tax=Achlya hypogyna TaxID=1202772 RepID=A0A1V9Z1C2_ACHHY|nr:metalloprotease family M12A [Achlya hypogyna]
MKHLLLAVLAATATASHVRCREIMDSVIPPGDAKYLVAGQIKYAFGEPHQEGAIYQLCDEHGNITCFEEDGTADTETDEVVSCHRAKAKRRLGVSTEHKRALWPHATLCYKIDGRFTEHETQLILDATHTIASSTGVAFIEVDTCRGSYHSSELCGGCEHYVSITQEPNKRGTHSKVGYQHTAGQKLNLMPKSFKRGKGTIMHELLHSLGVSHEHVHPAAEAIVLRDHKLAAGRNNYVPRREAFVTQYDIHSIMHYHNGVCLPKDKSVKYCAIDENEDDGCVLPTEADCDEEATQVLGQRNGLSPGDIRNLQLLYDLPTSVTMQEVKV